MSQISLSSLYNTVGARNLPGIEGEIAKRGGGRALAAYRTTGAIPASIGASIRSGTVSSSILPGGAAGGNALSQSYQGALDSANQANESRYQDILGGYEERMKRLSEMSQQEQKDIRENWSNRKGGGQQDLVSRGLADTSALQTMQMGYDRQSDAEIARANDRRLQQEMSMMKDVLDFKERREDTGPDINQMIGLQEGLGQYGGGGQTMSTGDLWGGSTRSERRASGQIKSNLAKPNMQKYGSPARSGWTEADHSKPSVTYATPYNATVGRDKEERASLKAMYEKAKTSPAARSQYQSAVSQINKERAKNYKPKPGYDPNEDTGYDPSDYTRASGWDKNSEPEGVKNVYTQTSDLTKQVPKKYQSAAAEEIEMIKRNSGISQYEKDRLIADLIRKYKGYA